jgi:hypothetical protein
MSGIRYGFASLALVFVFGCGVQKASITGRITLDGAPLETGSIAFLPVDGTESPSAGAVISKGEYEVPRDKGPKPGHFRVEIKSQRATGKQIPAGSPHPPGTMVDEVVEVIPENYNKASTLRFEVKSGANPANFDLTTK